MQRTIETGIDGGVPPRLAFSPDCRTLGVFGTASRLWDVETGRPRRKLRPFRSNDGIFHPDKRRLIVSNTNVIETWDRTTGEKLHAIPLKGFNLRLIDFDLSPDGRHIVTANSNGTAYILRMDEN
ncbi:MAG: hypothetical protein O3A00_07010 [Planctomycetota bacterium]|nr:hypothetical protein [Planctomycetota bacterium]